MSLPQSWLPCTACGRPELPQCLAGRHHITCGSGPLRCSPFFTQMRRTGSWPYDKVSLELHVEASPRCRRHKWHSLSEHIHWHRSCPKGRGQCTAAKHDCLLLKKQPQVASFLLRRCRAFQCLHVRGNLSTCLHSCAAANLCLESYRQSWKPEP